MAGSQDHQQRLMKWLEDIIVFSNSAYNISLNYTSRACCKTSIYYKYPALFFLTKALW